MINNKNRLELFYKNKYYTIIMNLFISFKKVLINYVCFDVFEEMSL